MAHPQQLLFGACSCFGDHYDNPAALARELQRAQEELDWKAELRVRPEEIVLRVARVRVTYSYWKRGSNLIAF